MEQGRKEALKASLMRRMEGRMQVEDEELKELIDEAVVDVGSCKRTGLEVLKLCEVIYLPVKEDSVSLAKLEEFDQYLKLSGNGALQERIHRLKLPYHSCFGRKENYLEQLVMGRA